MVCTTALEPLGPSHALTSTLTRAMLAAAAIMQIALALSGQALQPIPPAATPYPMPAVAPTSAGARIVSDSPPPPRRVIYSFFFSHLANLEEVGDEQKALGNMEQAERWRTHEQRAIGLSNEESAILKSVAFDCNRAVRDQDAKIRAATKAFFDRGGLIGPASTAELNPLWEERTRLLDAHIEELRSRLGNHVFEMLDRYVRSNFGGSKRADEVAGSAQPRRVTEASNPATASNLASGGPSTAPPAEEAAIVSALAVDPDSPGVLYAGTSRGIYRSTSAGETWIPIAGPLARLRVSSVVADSGRGAPVYASTEGSGLFKSNDGGTTFTEINVGLNNLSVFALLIDRGLSGTTLYAATGGGVFRSTNAGGRWEVASSGLTDDAVTTMASGAGTTYAGTRGGKLFKTADRGSTWSEAGPVPWEGPVRALVVTDGSSPALFAAAETGLFKSADGGTSWTAAEGLPRVVVSALLADPGSSSHLYAATANGLWRSTDGGETWQPLNTQISPGALAFGSGSASTLYAGVRGSIWKSTDAGSTWKISSMGRPGAP